MAATFLPFIVPSPFGKAFTRHEYVYPDLAHGGYNEVNSYHYDYQGSPLQSRSPAVAVPSFASKRSINADDDAGRCVYNENATRSPSRRSYPLNATLQRNHGKAYASAGPIRKPLEQTDTFPIFQDPRLLGEHGFECVQHWEDDGQPPNLFCNQILNNVVKLSGSGHSNPTMGTLALLKHGEGEANPPSTTALDKSLGKTAENFRRWASTFRHKRSEHRQKIKPPATETELAKETTSTVSTLPLPHTWPRKRNSNASSRFVTTVQTASLSNDSISVLPPSHRYSRISDTRGNRGSDPRSSLDSQRASSISSSDEGALRRSIKRRQILLEVLSSEESYVGDLKALHNLFSTLLASIPTISPQTRNSIQRNVTEMLHLHEQIVDELHQVALRATLRQWRQGGPCQGPTARKWKWQSLDATSLHTVTPMRSHTAVSPDSGDVRSHGTSARAADPVEVADVARVFRNHMARFFEYEEYCAKYDIMVQELANSYKMVPQWSSYETGMEALANSLASLNQRGSDRRKGQTAADLLIKPVQRICKYPLLFSDLHRNTPVVDCPSSHAEVEGVLSKSREMAREINLATDDPGVRERIQRRWLLQDRLVFGKDILKPNQFRMLGHVLLCGVLHVAYQTNNRVGGGYMLCMLFKDYLLLAAPTAGGHAKFDVTVTIYLLDAKVVSSEDGRGLHCHNALFSWKVVFQSDNHLFELLFSACSATEQEQWLAWIERSRSLLALEGPAPQSPVPGLFTTTSLELKALAPIFGQAGTLARRISIQRAATVGTRLATCQVIIRNTHKPQDSQEIKPAVGVAINRSQSLLTTHRVAVLAPKRSERVRLEQSLADVWTRDTLPYPGMTLNRGGNIIRASAGSLARKLSLASMHAPFAKLSATLAPVGSYCSHEIPTEVKPAMKRLPSREGFLHGDALILDDHDQPTKGKGEAISEEIVNPPGPSTSTLSTTSTIGKLRRGGTRKKDGQGRGSTSKAGTEPEQHVSPGMEVAEAKLASREKRSNPLGSWKNMSTERIRHLLHSSK